MAMSGAGLKTQQTPVSVERQLETIKVMGSFILFLFSMSVPYFLMINVRFLMVAGYVPSAVDQTTGIIESLLLVFSAIAALFSRKAIRSENIAAYRWNTLFTLLLGTMATLMMVWEFWFHPVDAMSHYGETFLSTVGLCVFMQVAGLLTLLASRSRSKFLGINADNQIGYRTPVYFWVFVVISWLVMYAELYFI